MKNKQLERLFLEDREEYQLKDKTIIALNVLVVTAFITLVIYFFGVLILVGKI